MYHARSPKPSDQPSNIPSLSIIRTAPRTYYPTFHTTLHVLANIKTLCTTLTYLYYEGLFFGDPTPICFVIVHNNTNIDTT